MSSSIESCHDFFISTVVGLLGSTTVHTPLYCLSFVFGPLAYINDIVLATLLTKASYVLLLLREHFEAMNFGSIYSHTIMCMTCVVLVLGYIYMWADSLYTNSACKP